MKSSPHSRAASTYRGDYARVTTGKIRHISIHLTHEQFAALDRIARDRDVTRGALARDFVLEGVKDRTPKRETR